MRFRPILATIVCLAAAGALWAAEPRLEVRIEPESFGVEDTARLVIKIHDPTSDVSAPDLGALDNLVVVAGPSRGHEFSFVNGVSTTTVSFSYVIRAAAVGAASVGPVTVAADGARLSAEVLAVEVAPGSLQVPQRRRSVSPFPSDPFGDIFGRRRREAQKATVVLRHLVSSREVFLGQPVTATVVLDTTTAVDDFGWEEAPSYPGWWAQRIDPPDQITPELVEVDGVRFNRFTIARHVLVPLKTGELVVPALRARIGARSVGFLDPGQVVERSTPEIAISVTNRPDPPPGFAGAVGNLTYKASLDPQEIEFGESAVLTVTLSGTGNLPLVDEPPVWPNCDSCETYPPEEGSRVKVDSSGIHGSRSWRLTVVPRTWGELELGPVELAVFDPASGGYRSQILGPMVLAVSPPPPTPTPIAPVSQGVPGSNGPSSDPAVEQPHKPAAGVSWGWLAGALGAGAVIGGLIVWFLGRRRKSAIPPRMAGQSPAERARELQVTLERWWMDVRARGDRKGLKSDMEELRRELEAVRFAPGRADHSETILDLEERLRKLMRCG